MDTLFFKHFCDAIPDPVWLKDREGRFLYVNNAMCAKVLGCRHPRTALGKTQEYFAGRARKKGYRYDMDRMSEASDLAVYESGKAGNFYEYGFIHDKFYYFEIFKGPLVNSKGEPQGLFGLAKDITAYTAPDEELERYENQYRSIFEDSLEGIFQVSGDGKILSVNPALAEMFGYSSPEEMLETTGGLTETFFVDAGEGEEFMRRLEGAGLVEDDLAKACRKDDETLWIAISARAVPGPDGSLLCYEGTVKNITERKLAEEAIRAERKRFEMVLREIPFGLLLIDTMGAFKRVNQKFVEIFGYDLKDIPDGRTWFRKIYPDRSYRRMVISDWKQDHALERPGQRSARIYRVACKDGEVKIVRFISVRLPTEEFLLACEDITQKQISEEALENSERRLADIVSYLPDPTLVIDQNGAVIAWNRSMEVLTGTLASDIVGKGEYEYAIPFYRQRRPILADLALTPWDDLIRSRYPFVERDGDTFTTELFVETFGESGAYLWAKAKPLYDVSGRIAGAIETIRDVTEMKLAEIGIRQSEAKYRALFDESIDVIYILTPDGRLADINPAGIRLFGCRSREELLDMDLDSGLYYNETDRALLLKELERDGFVNSYEVSIRRKDGQKIVVSLNAVADTDSEGKVVSYRGTMRDITKMKALEQQLLEAQKMETVGRLAGGIAHDFNNMLNVILGNAQLAKMKMSPDDRPREYIGSIEQAVHKAADFVKQLLAVSRRQVLNTRVVSMNDVIADFSKMVNRVIGENIEMTFVPSARQPLVSIDVAQIDQVLLNLVVNARDSMPKGGSLTIMTSVENVVEDTELFDTGLQSGSYVVLTVSDTGEGIDGEVLGHVFEPFFTTKKQGEGTGLGLSVVYGIIRQHGGHIKVESVRGAGTSFRIYLPVATDVKHTEAREDMEVTGGRETIFVVEDDLVLSEIAGDILSALGYKVLVAPDGEAAVALFEEKGSSIDLVLLDVVMPKMEGTEVYRNIKRMRPSTPVLFVTGYGLERIDENFLNENDVEILYKPYSLEVLGRKVREILDGRAGG